MNVRGRSTYINYHPLLLPTERAALIHESCGFKAIALMKVDALVLLMVPIYIYVNQLVGSTIINTIVMENPKEIFEVNVLNFGLFIFLFVP